MKHNNIIYNFPSDIIAKSYCGYLLLISPSNGNWIVLKNQKQVDITKDFANKMSIREVYEKYKEEKQNIEEVIRELDGKHFCEKMEAEESSFTLRIYLTNNCNLRCTHCFMYADYCLKDELTYDEIINILYLSKNANCEKVIFTGGEVVLKKRFIDILKYAKKLGLYVQVLTNGVLWNHKMIRETSCYIDEIQISIDGFDEETNAAIRGKGVFDLAMKTVRGFIEERKSFVSVVITPTYDFIEKYEEKYVNFGQKMIEEFGTERFIVIFGKELLNGRNIKANDDKNNMMTTIVNKIYEKIYPNAELTTFVINHKNNRIYMNCGYGGLTINSNGDFYFCGRINEVKCYGNIRKIKFEDILKLRKKVREKTYVHNIIPCKDCEIRLICGGGCRVSNIPEITNSDFNDNKIFYRKCNEEIKNKFYKLMIEANEYLYW